MQLTPAITDYVNKRLNAASKFLESDPTAIIEVSVGKTTEHHKNGDIFKAEAHIVGAKKDIYVEASAIDLYAAIDILRDEVMRRLSADKGKRLSRLRRSGAMVKNMIKGMWPDRFRRGR